MKPSESVLRGILILVVLIYLVLALGVFESLSVYLMGNRMGRQAYVWFPNNPGTALLWFKLMLQPQGHASTKVHRVQPRFMALHRILSSPLHFVRCVC